MPYPFGPPPMDPLGMPPQAPAPIPPRNVAQDPRQQLLTIATLGAMLGAGPKSGVATGMGHGLVQSQQELQHLTDYHAQVVAHQQEQIAEQQRQAQAESDRRANTIKGVIQNLQEQGRKAPDIETFQQIATDGAAFLSNAVGMRGVTPQSVAQMMGTFVPPEHDKKFTDAWDAWMSNPSNKTLLEAMPEQAIQADVKVKIGKNPDGTPIYGSMPLGELADRAGHGFASINGKPVPVPKKSATGQYQKDKMLVDGRVTDVLVNPTPGAEGHVFGLDGKPIDASRVAAFVPSDGAASDANYTLNGKGIVAVRNRSGRIMYQGQDVTDQVTPYVPPTREPAGGATGGLTPEGIEYAATQYRVTGVMPPMGMGGGGARSSIINKAAEQTRALGQTPAAGIQKQAIYKADAESLKKIKSAGASAEAFESKALQQADLVSQLSPTVDRTKWPIINNAILSGKTQIAGDQQATLLVNAVTTFSAEYAKIMEGSTGSSAGSSDSARRASERLISASMNPRTLQATLDQMKREMRFTIQGYDAATDHITQKMGGAPPAAAAAPDAHPPLQKFGGTYVWDGAQYVRQ